MDKRLIHAVAGAGKTTTIINNLVPGRRSLIITYTNQNLFSLESGIRKKFGGKIPEYVEIRSYFSFLYAFCIRPYISYKLRDKGLIFGTIPPSAQRRPKSSIGHYVSKARYLYAARAAKLVRESNILNKVRESLERHYDCLYIDEVQDFAANDFNLLLELSKSNIDFLCVGDFFQHTFDTSRDGNTRSSLHTKGVDAYLKEFASAGFVIDADSMSRSHRCSPEVCAFITKCIGIEISSARSDSTSVTFIEDAGDAQRIHSNPKIVKLFWDEHTKYNCFSNNWGNSKGLNHYDDVCVVLNNNSSKMLNSGKGKDMKPMARNKLYVACSRARGNLYFLDETKLKRFRNN